MAQSGCERVRKPIVTVVRAAGAKKIDRHGARRQTIDCVEQYLRAFGRLKSAREAYAEADGLRPFLAIGRRQRNTLIASDQALRGNSELRERRCQRIRRCEDEIDVADGRLHVSKPGQSGCAHAIAGRQRTRRVLGKTDDR
jgi:hypothetical protein